MGAAESSLQTQQQLPAQQQTHKHTQHQPAHLLPEQLVQLRAMFARVSRGSRSASIDDLRALPELAGNPMVRHIFAVLDVDGDGSLSVDEFITAAREWRHIDW